MGMPTTTLASSLAEHVETDGVYIRTSFRTDAVTATKVEALAAAWPTPEHLWEDLAANAGSQVTLIMHGSGSHGASLFAAEGRFFRQASGSGEGLVWIPKGRRTNGFVLGGQVLDYRPGWKPGVAAAQASVDEALAAFPQMTALSREDLEALPDREEDGRPIEAIGLTVFGTWAIGGEKVAGSYWLFTDYDRQYDVVNGYLRVPDGSGHVSEHGSVHGRDLLAAGMVKVHTNASLSFADALNLGEIDDATAASRMLSAPA